MRAIVDPWIGLRADLVVLVHVAYPERERKVFGYYLSISPLTTFHDYFNTP